MESKEEMKQRRLEEIRREKWNRIHKIINGIDHKKCSMCNEYKPSDTDNFYSNKSNTIDGLNPYCKKCNIEENKKYNKENPEVNYRADKKRYNKERVKYLYNSNKKRVREGKYRQWTLKNKNKVNDYSRFKYANKKHNISLKEWDACRLYFNYRCAYCDKTWEDNYKETTKDLHKEHVDHNGNNSLDNCVPSCMSCNSTKHTDDFESWYNEENEVYSPERYLKIIKWISFDHKKFIVLKEAH